MDASQSVEQARRRSRGFTLIEVMFATLLLGVVGMAIVGFIGAYARGIEARTSLNDPALDSAIASRRLAAMAPGFCYVLQVRDGAAAIWLSDTVPSCTVHLSELGVVRFDDTLGTLVFDMVDPAALAADPTLDVEFTPSSSADFIGAMEAAAESGQTITQILAESLDAVAFSTAAVPAGHANVVLTMPSGIATVVLSPPFLEEPLR